MSKEHDGSFRGLTTPLINICVHYMNYDLNLAQARIADKFAEMDLKDGNQKGAKKWKKSADECRKNLIENKSLS